VVAQIIEKFAAGLAVQLAASSQPGGSQPGNDRPSDGRPAVTPGGANGARRRVTAAPTGPGRGATSDAAGIDQDGGSGLGLPIEELGLPLRAFNSLRREGIHTVGDLSARNEADLLAIANLGPASVREIKQKLAERGLQLAPASAATVPAGAPIVTAGAGAAPDQGELPAPAPQAARPPDEDAIDLLSVAGFPVLKRALPIAAAAAMILLLVLLRTRRRHHRRANASPS
jgi:Bacterial RNA polymerase, alpha chain C terminal domain